MNKPTEDILTLSQEVREISDEIAVMKRKKNEMVEGGGKESLKEDIKMKQYQALFYIDKMGNLSREMENKSIER